MAWETAAYMIPSILEILGVSDITAIPENLQNLVKEMANDAYAAWNEKINKNNYSTANLASGKPDFNWLRTQIYEKQAQNYYDFQKEMKEAEQKDKQSYGNTGIGKALKTAGSVLFEGVAPVVDVLSGITGQFGKWAPNRKQAKSNIASWGHENRNATSEKWIAKLKQDEENAQKELEKINKQQIRSHNSARNDLTDYRNNNNNNNNNTRRTYVQAKK